MPGWLQHLDEVVLHWIHQTWRTPWGDAFFVWITDIGHFTIPLAFAWVLLFVLGGRRGRVAAIALGVTLLLTDQISSHVIKPWAARTRPCFEVAGVEALVAQARSGSFPSSHAANMFGAAAVLSLGAGGFWRLFFVPALLVGLSRIYVGVHYPTDVVGGAVLGIVLGATVWRAAAALGLPRARATETARPAVGSPPQEWSGPARRDAPPGGREQQEKR